MKVRSQKFIVAVVAPNYEIEGLRTVLEESHILDGHVEIRFISLVPEEKEIVSLNRFTDIITKVSEDIRAVDPHMIVIGQNTIAEHVVSRLRMSPSPLIVRWSRFYGNEKGNNLLRTPVEAGYHLDLPKNANAILEIIRSTKVISAVTSRDLDALTTALPEQCRRFSSLLKWSQGKVTPKSDLIPEDSIIKEYIYLDEEGIDSLFVQTGRKHLESVVRRKSLSSSGKAAGKMKLGKLLEFFGIGEAELTGDFDHGRTYSEEFIEQLQTAGKLKVVVDALIETNSLVIVSSDLDAEIPKIGSCFVDLTSWFDTRDVVRAIAAKDPNDRFAMFQGNSRGRPLVYWFNKFIQGPNLKIPINQCPSGPV